MTPLEKNYTAAILIIGNEILSGRTQDTNIAFLTKNFVENGITVEEVRIVPDIEERIINTVQELKKKVDYVVTTGGIGPTHDDITAEAIAKAFKVKLELHPEAHDILLKYYGKDELTAARMKMAMIPITAHLIENPVTAAPGFNIGNVYVLAGVPEIMRAMFDHILQMIEKGDPVLSRTLSCKIPESAIAGDLGVLQTKYPDIEIGSYPHYRKGILGLSLVLRSRKKDILEEATQEAAELIRTYGDEPVLSDEPK
jgi:molybdenum cofactor synthesis domain-containing protein